MRRKYCRVNAVGIGTATLTATDGTNTAIKEVEVADYQSLIYLYSAITPSFTPVTGDMVDLSTGNKYVELGLQKNGQVVENPIFDSVSAQSSSFWDEEWYPEDIPVVYDTINVTEQEGITGPHGGPVYEISYNDPQTACPGFGIFTLFGYMRNIRFNYAEQFKYQICSPVTALTVNNGNNYVIPMSLPDHSTIPITYTQTTEDNLNPIFVYTEPESGMIMKLASNFPTRDGQGAGTIGFDKADYYNYTEGVLKVVYANGTDIVKTQIGIESQSCVFEIVSEPSPVLASQYNTWQIKYSPEDVNPDLIEGWKTSGLDSGSKTIDRNTRIITQEYKPKSLRSDQEFGFSYTGYGGGRIQVGPLDVKGDGYIFNPTYMSIHPGETGTLTYQAFTYDSTTQQQRPILQQSTIGGLTNYTIVSHTFDSTTGIGTLVIESTSASAGSAQSLQASVYDSSVGHTIRGTIDIWTR